MLRYRLHGFRIARKENNVISEINRRMEPSGSERHRREARRASEWEFAGHYAGKINQETTKR
jgi:hypothetical protein